MQIQKQPAATERKSSLLAEETAEDVKPKPRSPETQDVLDAADQAMADIDDVLNEAIDFFDDTVTEEEALDLVTNFKQLGGE